MSWYIQALKNYTKFSGRAQRNEFWFFGLFNNLILASFLVVDVVTSGVPALSTLFLLWTFIPALSVTVRRLHDIGESGWLVLLAFIPIVGWLILVSHYVSDSQPGPNVYGENPKGIQLKEDAPATEWYANGQKEQEVHYKNGKQEGLATYWYENGQKEMEGHCKDGKADGLWTSWHENGRKSAEEYWKNGELDGLATLWHENGRKSAEYHYKNGEEVSRKEF